MSQYLNLMENSEILFSKDNPILGAKIPEGIEPSEKFYSCDPIFRRDISNAITEVKKHFLRESERPLNSLILGPPGSGKSFLAKRIGNACEAEYLEKNLSQLTSPQEIIKLFEEIETMANETIDRKLVVLIDEFDVKIGGGSAVQYLISPIYDNKKLHNVAFIFSGSYVKSRELLETGLNNSQEFDFFRFLVDYRVHLSPEYGDQAKELQDYINLISKMEQRALDHPDSNILTYLQSLEKLIDFRSRINGFRVEIPPIDSPLDLTQEKYQLSVRKGGKIFPKETPVSKYVAFVEAIEEEGRFSYEPKSPWQVFADYQDAILRERLSRIGFSIGRKFKKADRQIKIKRGILNYLVVAPLINGMRSLEFLINELDEDLNDETCVVLNWPKRDSDERLAMHIRGYVEFKGWVNIWKNLFHEYKEPESFEPSALDFISLKYDN